MGLNIVAVVRLCFKKRKLMKLSIVIGHPKLLENTLVIKRL